MLCALRRSSSSILIQGRFQIGPPLVIACVAFSGEYSRVKLPPSNNEHSWWERCADVFFSLADVGELFVALGEILLQSLAEFISWL
jgi:hypothetical protein